MQSIAFCLLSVSVLSAWAEDQLPPGVDRRLYCETCLATVQVLKNTLNAPSSELSRTKIKAHMGEVCTSPVLREQSSASDKAAIACNHLLDLYGDKFEDAFLTEHEDTLEATLCYIYSMACTGVKRKSFQNQKQDFQDGVIEEFLQKHAHKIRLSRPTMHESSLQNKKEEL
ncbi:uncharacterized protein WCC33_013367 [Rhinophrynus dorsalis]